MVKHTRHKMLKLFIPFKFQVSLHTMQHEITVSTTFDENTNIY